MGYMSQSVYDYGEDRSKSNSELTPDIDVEYLKERFSFLENITNIAKIYLDENVNQPINRNKKKGLFKTYTITSLSSILLVSGLLSFSSLFFLFLILTGIPAFYIIERIVNKKPDSVYINIFIRDIKQEELQIDISWFSEFHQKGWYIIKAKNKDDYEILTEIMDYVDSLELTLENFKPPMRKIYTNDYDEKGLGEIKHFDNKNEDYFIPVRPTDNINKRIESMFSSNHIPSIRNDLSTFSNHPNEIISSSTQLTYINIDLSSESEVGRVNYELQQQARSLVATAKDKITESYGLISELNQEIKERRDSLIYGG